MSTRVAILTNIPAPYRLPVFRLLSRQYDLEVVFDAPSEPNRSWTVSRDLGFPHCYVKGFTIPYRRKRSDLQLEDERYLQVRYGIVPALHRIRPRVVVSLELGLRTLQAAWYSRLTGIPMILWWEGTPHSDGWVSENRRRVRRYLVRQAARFWTNGEESAELLREYGADSAAIDRGFIAMDTRGFRETVRSRLPEREAIRNRFGLKGAVILVVGQIVARKGVEEFVRALEILRGRTKASFSVLWIGDGPERSRLEQYKLQHPDCNLQVLSFRPVDEFPDFYAAADIFVLPTLDDVWGLVAVEATVAGLPQIFSPYAGATRELLARGAPGCVADPRISEEFADALCKFVEDVPPRAENAVINFISETYSPETCARRAHESIEAALNGHRRSNAGGQEGRAMERPAG